MEGEKNKIKFIHNEITDKKYDSKIRFALNCFESGACKRFIYILRNLQIKRKQTVGN